MARRGWDQLSDTYRQRLERSGISQSEYQSGASLAGARGHGATPERPLTDLENVPSQYQAYADLRREIVEFKRELLQQSGRQEDSKWQSRTLGELAGKSRATLEKARDILDARINQSMSWDELRLMYPELEDDGWEWLFHYH